MDLESSRAPVAMTAPVRRLRSAAPERSPLLSGRPAERPPRSAAVRDAFPSGRFLSCSPPSAVEASFCARSFELVGLSRVSPRFFGGAGLSPARTTSTSLVSTSTSSTSPASQPSWKSSLISLRGGQPVSLPCLMFRCLWGAALFRRAQACQCSYPFTVETSRIP